MIKKTGYQWRLRALMGQRELYQTTDLVPLLAGRVEWSCRESKCFG